MDTEEILKKAHRAIWRRVDIADGEAINMFASGLDDADLRMLIQMLGKMVYFHDHKSVNGTGNLSFFVTKLSDPVEHPVAGLALRCLGKENPSYDLDILWPLLTSTLQCEDRSLDDARVKAHRKMLSRYEPIHPGDPWTYTRSPLPRLVNNHPEDVDLILMLREERNIAEVTEELLLEFKRSHSSIVSGQL